MGKCIWRRRGVTRKLGLVHWGRNLERLNVVTGVSQILRRKGVMWGRERLKNWQVGNSDVVSKADC